MNFAKPDKFTHNPAKFFLEWIGVANGGGGFKYWDKEEKKQKEIKDLASFRFVLLDDNMMGITGYNNASQRGIWSNEIPSMEAAKTPLKVRIFNKEKTVIAEGLYQDIKNDCVAAGGKYMKSVYIMTNFFDGEMGIYNLKAYGCCVAAWMNLQELSDKQVAGTFRNNWVHVEKIDKVRASTTKQYDAPVFGFCEEITEPEEQKAMELATILAEYLEQYTTGDIPEIDPAHEAVKEVDEEKPPTDTSTWQSYTIPGTDLGELGKMKPETLLKMKAELESVQTFDATYDNICAGVMHYQELSKTQNAEVDKVIPPAAAAPVANPFFVAKPEPMDWREVLVEETGKKLKEFTCESLQAMANFCETDQGAEFKKYLPAIKAGIEELIVF